jgi:hypothetical protein
MRKKPFNITLEPEQIEALRLMEKMTGIMPSEQIRRAITEWLQRHMPTLEQIQAEKIRRGLVQIEKRRERKAQPGRSR